jgi:hypothetical protein
MLVGKEQDTLFLQQSLFQNGAGIRRSTGNTAVFSAERL